MEAGRLAHGIWCVLFALTAVVAQAQSNASCEFTLFKLPNSIAQGDFALGINSYRTVVGEFENTDKSVVGFIRFSDGHLNFFAPGAPTWFTSRNDSKISVGVEYTVPNPIGFMLHGSSGVTPIIHPKAMKGTFPTGINHLNAVVGYYLDSNNMAHGFKYSNGTFQDIIYPNAQQTTPMGINVHGEVVGGYADLFGVHGFIHANGKWTLVEYPNVAPGTTILNGVSDDGTIIGFNNSTPQGIAFLYKNGVFKKISDPAAAGGTYANGIAPNGWITGDAYLTKDKSSSHGFIAACQ
jgi:probable HAF family extracellular repeat protein